jgi:hypothetical protein
VAITNLDDLREAVEPVPPVGCDWCIPGITESRASTLGGAEAWRIWRYGYEYPAHGGENALYVLAIHEGRPYFLRFHSSAERAPENPAFALWDEILGTFAFLP